MMLPTPIPVTLLTGFLGSGKTTLLNRLIGALPRTAVVMNEFGEIGLDHQLLQRSAGPLALLSGGCVCCTVKGGLSPTLKNLFMAASNGEIPAFERVVIETSGIADPAPIINSLINERWVAARFAMQGVVTTVDAQHGLRQLDAHEEAVKQIALADRLVLTKTDLVDAQHLATLRTRLADLNPGATQLTAVRGDIDPLAVLHATPYNQAAHAPEVVQWLCPAAPETRWLGPSQPRPHFDARLHAHSLAFDRPLQWKNLYAALNVLTATRPEQLLRLKGILNLQGETQPSVIHGVQHIFYPPAQLDEWPDTDRRSRMVIVTYDMPADAQRQLIRDFSTTLSG